MVNLASSDEDGDELLWEDGDTFRGPRRELLYDEEDHDEHDDNNLDDEDDHAERADRYATGGSRESRGVQQAPVARSPRTVPFESHKRRPRLAVSKVLSRKGPPHTLHVVQVPKMWLLPRADIDEIERKDRLCDYGLWKRGDQTVRRERSAAAIAGSETRYETVLPYVATSTLSD